jgi:hypothetical protein
VKRHRKIYEEHYGSIPVDDDGRSYDIHHINGNHSDNRPENLKAVSIKEHYEIHLSQGDLGSAFKVAQRMNISPEEKSKLATDLARQRIENGTHHLLGGEITRKRVAEGTHHWLSGEIQRKSANKRVEEGTHPFLGGELVRKKVADGTHNFLGGQLQKKRVSEGTHHFLQVYICPHCNKAGKGPMMKKYHFDKCKVKI